MQIPFRAVFGCLVPDCRAFVQGNTTFFDLFKGSIDESGATMYEFLLSRSLYSCLFISFVLSCLTLLRLTFLLA